MYAAMIIITAIVVFPFLWMVLLSFKSSSEIMSNPLAMPKAFNLDNFKHALETLNFPQLYANTFVVCILSVVLELIITFCSSFVIARMEFKHPKAKSLLYGFLILGLSVSPFILLFPVYKINIFFGLSGKWALIFPYAASSISFNTLLLTAYLKQLPTEIDEAAVIDGCNIWQLMVKVILPMAKPVIATIVIFNVLYIWNEYPYASVMLKDVSDYTLSMGASFFKGNYTVDYGGIVAITGFAIGKITFTISCQMLQPSITAASSISVGSCFKYAVRRSVLNEIELAAYGKINAHFPLNPKKILILYTGNNKINGETDNPKIKNPYNKLFAFGCLNSILAITKELQNVIISSNTTDNIHTTKVFAYNCGKFNVSNACLKLSRLNAFGIANGLDMISELDLNESNTIL